MAVLARIDAWDRQAGAAVALRAASEDDARVCMAGGETWWPVIGRLPRLRYDLFSGRMDGRVDTPGASLTLATEPWTGFSGLAFADARCRLWRGEPGEAWPWTLLFDGRVTAQPAIAGGMATIEIAVDDRWLDAPLLATYAGTGGAEGHAGLRGAAKPLALGAPRYQAGVLIDPANTVVQLSSRPIRAVDAALERLARFGGSAGNHAGYAALVAASIPPGAWATARSVGMVRHGAPPAPGAKLSYLVEGDDSGGWARRPGALIARICAIAGQAARVDAGSLAALDAARPWTLSAAFEQQLTVRDAAQRIAASVNAVAGVSWTGQQFAAPVGIAATPALTLHADGTALPIVAKVEQLAAGVPMWRDAVEAVRAWNPHALDEIAFTAQLVELGPYSGANVYREGNIVQHGGSSWLYTNPTPTAGNAPPNPPATSNGWWRVLAAKGTDGQPGQDGQDGTDALFRLQGSVNGSSWHDGLQAGDRYMRTSQDGGASFGPAVELGGDTAAIIAKLDQIASDGWLTPDEKKVVIREQQAIEAENVPLNAEASRRGVSATAFNNARNALYTYIANTITPPFDDTAAATEINRAIFEARFETYYAQRALLKRAISDADADNFLVIFSDNLLSRDEKPANHGRHYEANIRFQRFDQRYAALGSPADITPSRNAAFNALGDLNSYTNGIIPSYADFTTDSPINGATYASLYRTFDDKEATFEAAVTGRQGPPGPQGPAGPPGPPGPGGAPKNYTVGGTYHFAIETTVASRDAGGSAIMDYVTVPGGLKAYLSASINYTMGPQSETRYAAWKMKFYIRDTSTGGYVNFGEMIGSQTRYDAVDNFTLTGQLQLAGSWHNTDNIARTYELAVNIVHNDGQVTTCSYGGQVTTGITQ